MTREELKERIDDLTDEEIEVLARLFGPSEDEEAARSVTLQAEIRDALSGKLRGRPAREVAREMGIADV